MPLSNTLHAALEHPEACAVSAVDTLPKPGTPPAGAPTSETSSTLEDDIPERVTDEQLEQLLYTDGLVTPALQGNCDNGIPKIQVAREMLHRCRRSFALDAKNPIVSDIEHIGVDTGDAKPIADGARRYGQKEAEFIMEYVAIGCKRRHLEPSRSAWASNPVLIRQGDKLRFCVDYRKLNTVTKRDSHGLGNIDDMLQKLRGATLFSSLDLAAGYHQLPLSLDARPKTAFRTPNGGLYQYTVAPFGLVNLPGEFTRVMHSVLGETLNDFAQVYMDDVLSYSKTFEEHISHLEKVLNKISAANLSCSLPKSQLFREQLKYVGHIIGAAGTWPAADKVQDMLNMQAPLKDGKVHKPLVQSLVGLFNYYRRYVLHYSNVAAPILRLLRTDEPQVWTEGCAKAFETLKSIMAGQPVIDHPDFNKPFVIQ